jgi:hypothetical protein
MGTELLNLWQSLHQLLEIVYLLIILLYKLRRNILWSAHRLAPLGSEIYAGRHY